MEAVRRAEMVHVRPYLMIVAENIRSSVPNQVEHVATGLAGRIGSDVYHLLIRGILRQGKTRIRDGQIAEVIGIRRGLRRLRQNDYLL